MSSVISRIVAEFKNMSKNGGEVSCPFYFLKKTDKGFQASNADGQCIIARRLSEILNVKKWQQLVDEENPYLLNSDGKPAKKPFVGQTCGKAFEYLVKHFIEESFVKHLNFLRPGSYTVLLDKDLKDFEQYKHLRDFDEVLAFIPPEAKSLRDRLEAAFSSYAVSPDILVLAEKNDRDQVNEKWEDQSGIKRGYPLISDTDAPHTNLLKKAEDENLPNVHAIVSIKWTMRSDRAQNARTEGVFSAQERRGKAPHFVVVTGEPRPSRIRSLALGSDIDCVYHAFLPELMQAIETVNPGKKGKFVESERRWLETMLEMNRLRDISTFLLTLCCRSPAKNAK
ncbi:NgoMIV family type II restriction endonuclease [uncultured Pseudodesulfovibrio sp.]|uniref:NgoMIV family type II restriction endonuclease n=1 Tax=uncultured Pseudodesulfovibrio sp. TaxID=2035858 RepID=UPI0029C7F910|nr:NgoMIV family type II restriction endonuclease [uncultured Pseudodesulfovibrio sp.]